MNLKKVITSKISDFDKPIYLKLFNRILNDLAEGKIHIKDSQNRKDIFPSDSLNLPGSLWHHLTKAFDDCQEPSVPKIVYFYLIKKAQEKLKEIRKFSSCMGLDYCDTVKLVIIINYYISI